MNAIEKSANSSGKAGVAVVVLLVILAGLVAAGIYLRPRFEAQPPQITFKPDTDVIGAGPIEVAIADQGAGLKAISVTLVAGGTESPLAAEQFPQAVPQKSITVSLAKVPGVKEGPATLRVVARDASLWGMFKGNEAVVQKQITIDITPPTLELVADDRYVNFGGVGALVYKPAADTVTSGVKLGAHFYPGAKGVIKGQPEHFFVLFAHAYDVPQGSKAMLVATDKAGNTREMPVVYELKDFRYRKSTIAVSDNFIQGKVASLVPDAAARQGTPKEVFVAVNEKLRKANEEKILEITKKASPAILWNGAFVQLSNSKVEANFADHRTYTYNGEPISTSYHLGYDLSVTKRYPVEAANAGKVVFVGELGIYGNTVILDHGLGLFTLYSHLSSFDVKDGDSVQQKHILGKTGETGLAAGDHLHYGVYLHGVAVLPVEWWDSKWIHDNIQPKLEGMSGDAIHEAQQPSRARAGKRRR